MANSTVAKTSLAISTIADYQSENVPALYAEMPDRFDVEFAPSFPLSIGNALSVRAKRFHCGLPKSE